MIRYFKHLRFGAVLSAALLGSVSIASAQWPESPGKEVTLQLCGNCHEANIIQAHRQSRDEWIATSRK
jgi:cytochrome c5